MRFRPPSQLVIAKASPYWFCNTGETPPHSFWPSNLDFHFVRQIFPGWLLPQLVSLSSSHCSLHYLYALVIHFPTMCLLIPLTRKLFLSAFVHGQTLFPPACAECPPEYALLYVQLAVDWHSINVNLASYFWYAFCSANFLWHVSTKCWACQRSVFFFGTQIFPLRFSPCTASRRSSPLPTGSILPFVFSPPRVSH